jgi:hypothetical protein
MNETGYNTAYNISDLIAWVRIGYHPTNTAYQGTGSPADGSPDIGALSVVPPAPALRTGLNAGGTAIQVNFPGKFVAQLGSGDNGLLEPDYHGLSGLWDAKNDSMLQYNFANLYAGAMWTKMNWKNADMSDRFTFGASGSESQGTVTVVEQNDLRVQLKYSFQIRAYGVSTPDCCLSMDQYFTFQYPDKVYRTSKLNYTGTDGNAPLTWSFLEYLPSVTWARYSNEPTSIAGWQARAACGGGDPSHVLPRTPSPWNFIYQDPTGSNANKTYLLYTPVGTATSPYPLSNDCLGVGDPGLATPGVASHCAVAGCVTGGIDYTLPVAANMLWLTAPSTTFDYPALTFQYFTGARTELGVPAPGGSIPAGTAVSTQYVSMRVGDNGVTSKATALEYVDEYTNLVAPTMSTGTVRTGTDITNGFNYLGGAYALASSSGSIAFTTHNIQHYPVFEITGWSAAVPATITVGGVTKAIDTDYWAIKTDLTTLLLQYRGIVADGLAWVMGGTGTCEATGGGTCYYFDPTKVTSGTGTFIDPWGQADLPNPSVCAQTFTSSLNPGDILYFRAGTLHYGGCASGHDTEPFIHPTMSGTSGHQITLKSYPGELMSWERISGTQHATGPYTYSYVTISGMQFLADNDGSPQFGGGGLRIGDTFGTAVGVEVSYNEVIGGSCTDPLCGGFNHDGLFVVGLYGGWIHHNKVHGFTTTDTNHANSSGIKVYESTGVLIESNWTYANDAGIFDKDASIGTPPTPTGTGCYNASTPCTNEFRYNWIQANINNLVLIGNIQGGLLSMDVHDNVIDGSFQAMYQAVSYFGINYTLNNNLFRQVYGYMLGWGSSGVLNGSNTWDNIAINATPGGTNNPIYTSSQLLTDTPAPITYFDYNIYSDNVSYQQNNGGTSFSMGTIQGSPYFLETHSHANVDMTTVFVDQISYVVKPPYTTNGRYGDMMGPKNIATSTILDSARYGPQLGGGGSGSYYGTFTGSFR